MSDMGPGAAVDYARVLSVLDEAWASATLPDDDLPRAPGVAAVLDKDGEDIFDRDATEAERQVAAYQWMELEYLDREPCGPDDGEDNGPAPVYVLPDPPPPVVIPPVPVTAPTPAST